MIWDDRVFETKWQFVQMIFSSDQSIVSKN